MRLLCLVAAVVLVGCGNGAPSCKDALAKAARTLGEDLPAQLEQLTAECERSGWTAEQRSCLANAGDKPTLAACVIIATASKARDESLAAEKAARVELETRRRAQEALDRAQTKLDALAKDLADFDGQLMAAQAALLHARNDAERAEVKSSFEALKKEKAELEARITAARAAALRAAPANGVQP